MMGKYDSNPLYEFEEILTNEIKNLLQESYDGYEPMDIFEKTILEYNSCRFVFGTDPLCKHIKIMNGDFNIHFIVNGYSNDINKVFDIFDINGTTYLAIFIDEFKTIDKVSKIQNGITNPDSIIGKSIYVSYLKLLAEVFIKLTTNPIYFTSTFNKTIIATNARYNMNIFAGAILYNIFGEIDSNDVEGCYIGDIDSYVELCKNSNLSYYGIRKVN